MTFLYTNEQISNSNLKNDMFIQHRTFNVSSLNFRQLLSIDNVSLNQQIITTFLSEFGFRNVDLAYNGNTIIILMIQKHYSLIVIDMNLSDTNGFQLYNSPKLSLLNEIIRIA